MSMASIRRRLWLIGGTIVVYAATAGFVALVLVHRWLYPEEAKRQ